MKHTVATGDSYESSCKFTKLRILIRKFRSIKAWSDFFIGISIQRPLKTGFSALYLQPHPDVLSIFHKSPCFRKFPFYSIFHLHNRNRTVIQCIAEIFIQIYKVHIIIIKDQTSCMLVTQRSKINLCCYRCLYTCQLSCQNTCLIQRAAGFLTTQANPAWSCFQVNESHRINARRIITDSKSFRIKVIPLRKLFHRILGKLTLLHKLLGHIASIFHSKPAILCPFHTLNGSFTAKSAAKLWNKRSGSEMYQPGFSVRKIHITGMTGFLKLTLRIIIARLQVIPVGTLVMILRNRSYNWVTWTSLIWSPYIFRTSHCHAVIISSSAFSTHYIVVIPTLSQMRCLNTTTICTASPESFWHSHYFFLCRIIFYNTDWARFLVFCSCLPFKSYNIFFAVIIMEHRSVKTGRMKINRFTPGAAQIFCCDQIVIYIKISGIHRIHNTIYYIKQIICFTVGQARCPDSFCTWQLF